MNNEEVNKKLKSISESKKFKIILYVFGIIIVVSAIFQAGVFVGFHKASFRGDWDDNFSRNFGARHGSIFSDENSPNANGAIGKIISINSPTMILEDNDNTEKVILIKDDTVIKNMRDNATSSDLTVDKFVIVIGSPNAQGQIEAKLIRILPEPPTIQ